MKNAIEIEELIKEVTHGNESLFSVIEEYEKRLENIDEEALEEALEDLEMKISFLKDSVAKCIDEIKRLLGILDRDTRKLNIRHSNKVIKSAEFYL